VVAEKEILAKNEATRGWREQEAANSLAELIESQTRLTEVEQILDHVSSGAIMRKIRNAFSEGADVNYCCNLDEICVALDNLDHGFETRYRREQVIEQRKAFELIKIQYLGDLEVAAVNIESEKRGLDKLRESVEMHSALAIKLERKKDALTIGELAPDAENDANAMSAEDLFKQRSLLSMQHEKIAAKVQREQQQLNEAVGFNNALMAIEDLHGKFSREQEQLAKRIHYERTRKLTIEKSPVPPSGWPPLLLAARSGSQPV